MSRIGKMPVPIPPGTTVEIEGNEVTVKGPKGMLTRRFDPAIAITRQDNNLVVSRPSDNREHRALHGLTRSLLANMVQGASGGFEKGLEIVGVGYRAQLAGEKITLRAGFSHQVEITPLPGTKLSVDGATKIKVTGADKELVGQMAANIRAIRPIDSFKGKGIKYAGEIVHLKAGKSGKAIGGKK